MSPSSETACKKGEVEGTGSGSESARCLSPFPALSPGAGENGDWPLADSEPVPVFSSAYPSHTPSE